MRSARTAIRAGVIPHIVNMPDGQDPNDFFQDAQGRADVLSYMRENVVPASEIFQKMESERLARDVARIGYVGRRVDVLGYICDRAGWPTEKLMELFSKHHNHCNA
jgi:DNA primase